MIERIFPEQENITINNKDYTVKIYIKLFKQGEEIIFAGIRYVGKVVLYEGQLDVETHKDDTEEQLRARLIELLATS
jgi:hypothetical protein